MREEAAPAMREEAAPAMREEAAAAAMAREGSAAPLPADDIGDRQPDVPLERATPVEGEDAPRTRVGAPRGGPLARDRTDEPPARAAGPEPQPARAASPGADTASNGPSAGRPATPAPDRSTAVRELAGLFSDPGPGTPRPAEPQPPAAGAEPTDRRKRVEDDDQVTRGLIQRFIDGVKGL